MPKQKTERTTMEQGKKMETPPPTNRIHGRIRNRTKHIQTSKEGRLNDRRIRKKQNMNPIY